MEAHRGVFPQELMLHCMLYYTGILPWKFEHHACHTECLGFYNMDSMCLNGLISKLCAHTLATRMNPNLI